MESSVVAAHYNPLLSFFTGGWVIIANYNLVLDTQGLAINALQLRIETGLMTDRPCGNSASLKNPPVC